MEKAIVGRYEEKKMLQEICESADPQFLAVYGRRRVGKTFLISEFFKNKGVYNDNQSQHECNQCEQDIEILPVGA